MQMLTFATSHSVRPDSDDLVIADFGIAKHITPGEVLTSVAGSPGYAAPEVLKQSGHGKAVDLWSIGYAHLWNCASRY